MISPIESATKEHPKNFKMWEVLAIQDDRKTQFREVIKPQPEYNHCADMFTYYSKVIDTNFACQSGDRTGIFGKYVIGDRLWIRETWQKLQTWQEYGNQLYDIANDDRHGFIEYKATNESEWDGKWKPSIYMPRSACRILLEITDVRIERLNDISEKDAIAEGIESIQLSGNEGNWWNNYQAKDIQSGYSCPINSFKSLWQSINAKTQPWESNPWVWVVEFKRIAA